jgi:hypothetical protein
MPFKVPVFCAKIVSVNGVSEHPVAAVSSAIERAWYMNRSVVRQASEELCAPAMQIEAYEAALSAVSQGKWW